MLINVKVESYVAKNKLHSFKQTQTSYKRTDYDNNTHCNNIRLNMYIQYIHTYIILQYNIQEQILQ